MIKLVVKIIFVVYLLIASLYASTKIDNETIYIEGSDKLIQGKTFNIIFNLNNLPEDNYFSDIEFYFTNGEVDLETFPLAKVEKALYKCSITIPLNCFKVIVYLSTKSSTFFATSYFKSLPVFRPDLKPEKYSLEDILLSSDSTNYLHYFYLARESNPEDLSIYAARWTYEYSRGFLVNDSIENVLNYLEKNFPNNADLPFLKLIGFTHINKVEKITELLQELSKKQEIKFSSNSMSLSDRIKGLLYANLDFSPQTIKQIYSSLFRDNPYSYFVLSQIRSGSFRNSRLLDSAIVINTINKILKKRGKIWSYILQKKTEILSTYFLPDSCSETLKLIEQISDLYETYSKTDTLYYLGIDPLHEFKITIGLFPNSIANWARKCNMLEEGNFLLKKCLSFIPSFDPIYGFICGDVAEFYFKLGNKDSALRYYAYSLQTLPQDAQKYILSIKMKLKKLLSDSLLSIEKLIAIYPIPKIVLTKEFPKIYFEDGSNIDILSVKSPKLLLFYDMSCSLCFKIFKQIEEEIDFFTKNNILIFLVTMDAKDKIDKNPFYKKFSTKVIKNSYAIFRFFNLNYSFPIIIAVDSNNSITYKSFGYSTSNKINWEEIFFPSNNYGK
ncbi:MAG: hypothetical protein ACPLXO_03580 [Desulfurella sp.]